MYGIFPLVFKKPMCLASGVVLCPVLLHKHPSLILLHRAGASPLPLSSSQGLFLLCSQLPSAFSWARSVCPKSQPGHRVPLSGKPCSWCCSGSTVHPSNTHPCFPFLPHLGGCYFSGKPTAPLTVSLAAQRRSSRAVLWRSPCYRRIGMQCLL